MPITEPQVAALRAFLLRDTEETAPLAYQLGDNGMPGFIHLADAALSIAAGRRFSPRFTSADLVRYVASVRSARLADGSEYDFDPVNGEDMLRYALGQQLTRTIEFESRLRASIALLDALTVGELSSEAAADQLLAAARELADRWEAAQEAR